MNYFPGQGLGIGTAILGSTVGQTYPAGVVPVLCKIYGVLVDITADPVGTIGSTLVPVPGGVPVVAPTWKGVEVTAALTIADAWSGKVVTIDQVSSITNELGYFEVKVIQGLTVVVTCPVFGKAVSVDTTGLTSVDISTFF